jgi:hypothetical protein
VTIGKPRVDAPWGHPEWGVTIKANDCALALHDIVQLMERLPRVAKRVTVPAASAAYVSPRLIDVTSGYRGS